MINDYCNIEFRLHRRKGKHLGKSIAPLLLISLMLIIVSTTFTSSTVHAESGLPSVLNDLGFTNIAPSDVETFPAGIYQFTFFAEFAEYYDINTISYYPVETTDYQTIFAGPEGSNSEPTGGFVIPPLSKTMVIDSEFGVSLLSYSRYFTEEDLNSDGIEHAEIYVNLDFPTMFLIGFEDKYGGGDLDFDDIIFSVQQIFPPEIVSVTRSPEEPLDNQTVTITAQVTKGTDDIESVILNYQVNSSAWTNVTMILESEGYVADVPAQPYNTQVAYRVYAFDVNNYFDVSALYSYTVRMLNRSPTAVISGLPAAVYTGENIYFNASESYDPDGEIVSYLWDFGDGETSLETTLTHSYEEDGEYIVTLKVVDDEGLTDNAISTQIVKNRSPVANFAESASTINKNEEVSFDASASYDVDGTISSYTWNFDNETMATGITVSHSFKVIGSHKVTLTVTDNDGATDTLMHTINVAEVVKTPPVASFTVSVQTASEGETIHFDGSGSYDSDGSIVSYTWNFGDGNTATGIKVDHAYEDAGTYKVTLTVRDSDSATDSSTRSLTVTETVLNQDPVAVFNKSAEMVYVGEVVSFDASGSHDVDGSIVSYSWDFGDGNTATGVSVEHSYNKAGTYTVTLIVTDDAGASASAVDEIVVEKPAETGTSLDIVSWTVMLLVALTAVLLSLLFIRRKRRKTRMVPFPFSIFGV